MKTKHIPTAGLHINCESFFSLPYAIFSRQYWCDYREECNSRPDSVIMHNCCSRSLGISFFLFTFNFKKKINGEGQRGQKKKKKNSTWGWHCFWRKEVRILDTLVSFWGWHSRSRLWVQRCLAWIHLDKMTLAGIMDCTFLCCQNSYVEALIPYRMVLAGG